MSDDLIWGKFKSIEDFGKSYTEIENKVRELSTNNKELLDGKNSFIVPETYSRSDIQKINSELADKIEKEAKELKLTQGQYESAFSNALVKQTDLLSKKTDLHDKLKTEHGEDAYRAVSGFAKELGAHITEENFKSLLSASDKQASDSRPPPSVPGTKPTEIDLFKLSLKAIDDGDPAAHIALINERLKREG